MALRQTRSEPSACWSTPFSAGGSLWTGYAGRMQATAAAEREHAAALAAEAVNRQRLALKVLETGTKEQAGLWPVVFPAPNPSGASLNGDNR